jgi:prefoldin subunit 5
MSFFETSKSSLRRDENSDAKVNLLSKVQQLEELLARLEKQLSVLNLECTSVRDEKQTVEAFLARKS